MRAARLRCVIGRWETGLRACLVAAVVLWSAANVCAAPTVNGAFDAGEWDAITPQIGVYSNFYYTWEGDYLYIMNDWWNTEPEFPLPNGGWNTFVFLDYVEKEKEYGDPLEFRVYNDNTVEAWENGVEITNSGIIAAYGFGPSLLVTTDHTLYEVKVPGSLLLSGTPSWRRWVRLRDPRAPGDVGDGGWEDGPFITPEPATLGLLALGGMGALLRRRKSKA